MPSLPDVNGHTAGLSHLNNFRRRERRGNGRRLLYGRRRDGVKRRCGWSGRRRLHLVGEEAWQDETPRASPARCSLRSGRGRTWMRCCIPAGDMRTGRAAAARRGCAAREAKADTLLPLGRAVAAAAVAAVEPVPFTCIMRVFAFFPPPSSSSFSPRKGVFSPGQEGKGQISLGMNPLAFLPPKVV